MNPTAEKAMRDDISMRPNISPLPLRFLSCVPLLYFLQWCYTYCSSKKATYMATQFGVECWCSQEADLDFSRHNDDESGDNVYGVCDMACNGEPVSCAET